MEARNACSCPFPAIPPRRRSAPFDILSLIVFQNGHISGALAELIRSTRAPTKDRLIGKIMGGNPVFRGTRVPVHMLAELVPSRACARTRVAIIAGSSRRVNSASHAWSGPLRKYINAPSAARAGPAGVAYAEINNPALNLSGAHRIICKMHATYFKLTG